MFVFARASAAKIASELAVASAVSRMRFTLSHLPPLSWRHRPGLAPHGLDAAIEQVDQGARDSTANPVPASPAPEVVAGALRR